MLEPVDSSYLKTVATNPESIEIDFSRIPAVRIAAKNINRCRISGTIGPSHDFNRANFTSSTLEDVHAVGVDFKNVDFKDCLVIDSTFTGCHFDALVFVNNSILRSEYSGCTFDDTSITETEFDTVRFEDCDFSNLLIKGCRFIRCTFSNCTTSNKLFEMSLLLECEFECTTLQVQTITQNFGLTYDRLVSSNLRSRDPKVEFTHVTTADLEDLASPSSTLSALERFRVAYFLAPDVILGSGVFDDALDVTEWLHLCRIPSSFTLLLEDFSEFLLYLWEQNHLSVHPLLKLHTTTSRLSDTFGDAPDSSTRVSRAVMGVHMLLSRHLEIFLGAMESLLGRQGQKVHFVADGPLNEEFYRRELSHVFSDRSVSLVEVRPHNSPTELIVECLNAHGLTLLMAAFLASRTKIQIQKLSDFFERQSVMDEAGQHASPNALQRSGQTHDETPRKNSVTLFSYSSGFSLSDPGVFEVRVRSLLPGTLVADLQLNVGTGVIRKFRDVLIELLPGGEVSK